MPANESSAPWNNPDYVAAIVGVLATGFLFFYTAITGSGPSTDEILFIILFVFLPMAIAHEIVQRWL
jgi:hypothetical protein